MRRGTLYALGALATVVGSAAMSQTFTVQKMTVLPMREMLRIRVPRPPLPPPPPQAPQVQFRGCVYYEHAQWGGKWRSIPGGTRRLAVGPSWNDLISSFSCNPACRVVAFSDDFKGQRADFTTISFVGTEWNDKISSMIAVCRPPF